MSKPLLGGGAVTAALISASFLFYAVPSVAEPLALNSSQDTGQTQQKQDGAAAKTAGTEAPAESESADRQDRAAEEVDKTKQTEGADAAGSEPEPVEPPVSYTATAYSLRGRTASGRPVRRGVIAADRRVLPIGTRVRLHAGRYSGDYLVADTGGAIKGRKIDIWVPSTREAMRFGRRPVKLTVLTRVRPRAAVQKKAR